MQASTLKHELTTAALVIICVVVCSWPARRLYQDLQAQDEQITIADATVISHQMRPKGAFDQDGAPTTKKELHLILKILHEAHPDPVRVLADRDNPAQYPIGSRLGVAWREAKRVVLDPEQLTRSSLERCMDALLALGCLLSLCFSLYVRRPAA